MTPAEVRALWADDLEHGGHKQGRLRLYDRATGGWCCMGRLQQLAIEHGVVEGPLDGADILPDEVVAEWAGLTTRQGDYADRALTSDNDGGVSFAEIAAIIRAEPSGLVAAS